TAGSFHQLSLLLFNRRGRKGRRGRNESRILFFHGRVLCVVVVILRLKTTTTRRARRIRKTTFAFLLCVLRVLCCKKLLRISSVGSRRNSSGRACGPSRRV